MSRRAALRHEISNLASHRALGLEALIYNVGPHAGLGLGASGGQVHGARDSSLRPSRIRRYGTQVLAPQL